MSWLPRNIKRILRLVMLFGVALPAMAAPEVILRHALGGAQQEVLETLVSRFNVQQKGQARVLLEDLRSVADPRQLPQMALLDADDSLEFFATRPRFKPLYQVLKESGEQIDAKSFFPLVLDAVDDPAGRLQALPLGLSLPVLFWNKEAFGKAGLNPEAPPKTWLEVQTAAGKLYDAGYKCPLTSSRFTWVHLENLSSQHGEPISVREGPGGTKVVLNRMVDVKHLALLSSWYKSAYFHYFGPGKEGDSRFLSGECTMLTGESSLYAAVSRGKFAAGVAALPHYDDFYGATPEKLLPDGAALWVLAGQKKEDYRIVAQFAKFLLRPEVQKEWVKATSYLPMTRVAIEALRADGSPPALLDATVRRLSAAKSASTRSKHGFGLARLRGILNEEIATVWSNTKPAKEALDTAMRRNAVPEAPGR